MLCGYRRVSAAFGWLTAAISDVWRGCTLISVVHEAIFEYPLQARNAPQLGNTATDFGKSFPLKPHKERACWSGSVAASRTKCFEAGRGRDIQRPHRCPGASFRASMGGAILSRHELLRIDVLVIFSLLRQSSSAKSGSIAKASTPVPRLVRSSVRSRVPPSGSTGVISESAQNTPPLPSSCGLTAHQTWVAAPCGTDFRSRARSMTGRPFSSTNPVFCSISTPTCVPRLVPAIPPGWSANARMTTRCNPNPSRDCTTEMDAKLNVRSQATSQGPRLAECFRFGATADPVARGRLGRKQPGRPAEPGVGAHL